MGQTASIDVKCIGVECLCMRIKEKSCQLAYLPNCGDGYPISMNFTTLGDFDDTINYASLDFSWFRGLRVARVKN
jgi:hypothetical protein